MSDEKETLGNEEYGAYDAQSDDIRASAEFEKNANNFPEHEEITRQDLQPKPTVEGIIAAEKALKVLRSRSFSERNKPLGKMKNCAVCGLRHREHDPSCSGEQTFAHRWIVDNEGNKVYTSELLIAGQTPETETVFEERKVNLTTGTPRQKNFSKPRRHPHSNRWLKAKENTFKHNLSEYKKRMAKPNDLWPSDPKVINNESEVQVSDVALQENRALVQEAGVDSQSASTN